jgi:predicted DNA binding protein
MRYLEIRARPSPEVTPALFDLIARSDAVEESRALDWNLSPTDVVTVFYGIKGHMTPFQERATEVEAIADFEVARIDDRFFHALLIVDPSEIPLLRRLLSTMSRPGLVILSPIVYRAGQVQLRLVANSSILQSTVETLPSEVDVEVSEIGSLPSPAMAPRATLTEKQRDALEAALDLGYYDSPATAGHEDIAARLGCAPSTASEHLKKGEAGLVRATMASEFWE